MNWRFLYLLPIVIVPLTASAQAGDSAQMKCGVNQDRVWVYDSVSDLNVEAKLKCNDPVEIVSRVKGYVKIRGSNGTEGYVPDSVFPDLPPLPPSPDESVAGSALARSAATRSLVLKDPLLETESVPVVPATARASVVSPAVTAQPTAAAPAPRPVSASVPASSVAEMLAAKPAITPSLTQPMAKRAAATAPSEAPALSAVNADPSLVTTPAANVAPPPIAAAPAPVMRVRAAAVGFAPMPDSTLVAVAPALPVVPASAKIAAPAKKPEKAERASVKATAPWPTPATAPAAATAVLTEAKMDVNPATVLSQPKMQPALVESEDYPDAQPENESADPACHIYFSAYGLSPSQFKWLAANRKKEYPNLCPAPGLASVDFVILFTHDSDTYTGAMPEPVHTDRSGFSDFNPMTTVDTALLSGADADKARREYVWVFQMKRGAFDPGKFSPRRRPQFTTVESKGSARALEDAFGYVQEQGATQVAANH